MADKQDKSNLFNIRVVYIIIDILMAITIISTAYSVIYLANRKADVIYLKQLISIIGMLFAMVLFIVCRFNAYGDKTQIIILSKIIALIFVEIYLQCFTDISYNIEIDRRFLLILQTVGYIISVYIFVLIWRYQCAALPINNPRRYFSSIIYVSSHLYFFAIIFNYFTGFIFYVDNSGHLVWPNEMIDTVICISYFIMYLIYIIPQHYPRKKKIALASFSFIPLASICFSIAWYFMGIETSAMSFGYICLLLSVYVVFFCDYRENQETLLLQKALLAEEKEKQTELKTKLMLSQIRPHFLYNSLTAIRSLCKSDPEKAYTTIGMFADYLRGNMDSIENGQIIPFEKELEHIKTYLTLEQLRFGDRLKIEFDIKYQDFSLPALSVQPIVENAVRHGVTQKEEGGTVTVSTEKTENFVTVTVKDDGVGFDKSNPLSDEKNHFGLANVQHSLEAKKCGALEINSTPGVGTTVKLIIYGGKT